MSNTDPDGLMPQSTVSRGLQGIMPTYFDRQFGLGGPSITWRPSALEQAQTSYAVNARMHTAGQFALGFIPGYDLARAALNPNASALDWTAGVLGVLPGLGKGAALGAKGIYAAAPLLGGAVREARAVEAVARADSVIAETLAGRGNIASATTLRADELLIAGEKFVGPGYKEIGKPGSGVFRSSDGTRQFRIDENSLLGNHAPGIPHGHLERFSPGATKPTANNHIPFLD